MGVGRQQPNIEFKKVTPIELSRYFPHAKGTLEFYIKHAFVYSGAVLLMLENEEPAGAVFLSHDSSMQDWEIDYIFVAERFRGCGLCSLAVRQLTNHLPPFARRLYARVQEQHSYAEALCAAFKKNGYKPCSQSTVYRCHLTDERVSLLQRQVREKWKGLFARLNNAGYEYVPLSDISMEKFRRYYPALMGEFPLLLDPLTLLTDPIERVDRARSLLALRDGRPAAIGIVSSTDGNTLVFRQLAVSFRDSGKGLSVAMCSAFAETLRGCGEVELLFTIHNENEKMTRIKDMLLLPILDSCKKQVNYVHEISTARF